MRKILLIVTICTMIMSFSAYAQSPDELKSRAMGKVELAKEFSNRAKEILRQGTSVDNMKIAYYLYSETQKLFKRAAELYKTLADNYYIDKTPFEQSVKAVGTCNQTLAELKGRIINAQRKRKRY